ncbi:hypothetical protein OAA19_02735 [Rubripirellula sp.]|nr:hypothetical protein [Rubripirellula sp.]MDB4339005.1 hypothetical protein [Rubripirellula sp.]
MSSSSFLRAGCCINILASIAYFILASIAYFHPMSKVPVMNGGTWQVVVRVKNAFEAWAEW